MIKWIIYNPKENLWWNNEIGWVDKLSATKFTTKQKELISNIPGIDSKWLIDNTDRLKDIKITKTLCLGTKLTLTAEQILDEMTDEQIVKMFEDNIDAQYILLEIQGHAENKK